MQIERREVNNVQFEISPAVIKIYGHKIDLLTDYLTTKVHKTSITGKPYFGSPLENMSDNSFYLLSLDPEAEIFNDDTLSPDNNLGFSGGFDDLTALATERAVCLSLFSNEANRIWFTIKKRTNTVYIDVAPDPDFQEINMAAAVFVRQVLNNSGFAEAKLRRN